MKNKLLILTLISLFSFGLVACQNSEKLLAKVNDVKIYQKDLADGEITLDAAIADEILYLEAIEKGYDKNFKDREPSHQKASTINYIKSKIMFEDFKVKNPTDEEIQQYYDSSIEKYSYFYIGQIEIISDKKVAEKIRQDAEELITLAKAEQIKILKKIEILEGKYKDEAQFVHVSFLDIRHIKDKEYKDILKPEVGYISDIIKVEESGDKTKYKIFVVADIKKVALNKIKNAIRNNLISLQKQAYLDQRVEEIKKKFNVKVEIL